MGGWDGTTYKIYSFTDGFRTPAGCGTGDGVISRLLDIGGTELLDAKDQIGRTAREVASAAGEAGAEAEMDQWAAQRAAWEEEHPKKTWILQCIRRALQCTIMQATCTAMHLLQANFIPMLKHFK